MSDRFDPARPLVHVYSYSGPATAAIGAEYAALLGRIPPVRRVRLERLAGDKERALQAATLMLLETALHRCGLHNFRLQDVDFPDWRKPFWPGGSVDFSLSHTDGIALCAIGGRVRVGVDVEPNDAVSPSIVTRVLSPSAANLPALSRETAAERWTQVEAVTKAAGLGVFRGGDILWTAADAELAGTKWYWRRLDVGQRYAAHVAADSPCVEVKTFDVELIASVR